MLLAGDLLPTELHDPLAGFQVRAVALHRQFSDQGLANPAVFPEESVTLWGDGNLLGAYQLSEYYRAVAGWPRLL